MTTLLEPQRREDTKKKFASVSPEIERLATEVVDSAFKVHSALGPGMLESVYETCLAHELGKRGLSFQTQVSFPIIYDGVRLDAGLRIDLLVENKLVVELKAVETMLPLFEAQLLTYLKLTDMRLGLLINFNVTKIKDGIRRIIL
ncbi:MAG TPA: GxxExxY protein [Verrucomicrobiae bacterium]